MNHGAFPWEEFHFVTAYKKFYAALEGLVWREIMALWLSANKQDDETTPISTTWFRIRLSPRFVDHDVLVESGKPPNLQTTMMSSSNQAEKTTKDPDTGSSWSMMIRCPDPSSGSLHALATNLFYLQILAAFACGIIAGVVGLEWPFDPFWTGTAWPVSRIWVFLMGCCAGLLRILVEVKGSGGAGRQQQGQENVDKSVLVGSSEVVGEEEVHGGRKRARRTKGREEAEDVVGSFGGGQKTPSLLAQRCRDRVVVLEAIPNLPLRWRRQIDPNPLRWAGDACGCTRSCFCSGGWWCSFLFGGDASSSSEDNSREFWGRRTDLVVRVFACWVGFYIVANVVLQIITGKHDVNAGGGFCLQIFGAYAQCTIVYGLSLDGGQSQTARWLRTPGMQCVGRTGIFRLMFVLIRESFWVV